MSDNGDGIDYSPAAVQAMRDNLIRFRDESYSQWPEAIPFTVAMTHTIAYMAKLRDLL